MVDDLETYKEAHRNLKVDYPICKNKYNQYNDKFGLYEVRNNNNNTT